MEEDISTRSPTDFKEILILTHRIGHGKSVREASQILNKFRHHTARSFASIFIFTQLLTPWIFSSVLGWGWGWGWGVGVQIKME